MPTGIVPSGSGARPRRDLLSPSVLSPSFSSKASTRPARLAAASRSARPVGEDESGGLAHQTAELLETVVHRGGERLAASLGPLDQRRAEADDDVAGITKDRRQL